MKKILLFPLLLVLILAGCIVWFYKNIQPVSGNKDFKDFLVTKGLSASQIGNKLESAGLVKSALAFKIYLQFSGQAGKMQAGEFRLTPSFTLFQVVNALTQGPIELWVTIPEGLRREEIAVRFAKGLDRDSAFVTDFLNASKGNEGKLFPDTYLFPKDVSAEVVVNKMVRTFESKTSDLSAAKGLNFEERLVLASIIERETKTAEERPIVAGVLINRLDIGMALQVDAAVQYAVASAKNKNQIIESKWWEPLTKDDLAINSPYNTYKFPGLPPAPIASPGLASIKAAFEPAGTDYMYYIHDASGGIHFAETLAEHNSNIAKYLR